MRSGFEPTFVRLVNTIFVRNSFILSTQQNTKTLMKSEYPVPPISIISSYKKVSRDTSPTSNKWCVITLDMTSLPLQSPLPHNQLWRVPILPPAMWLCVVLVLTLLRSRWLVRRGLRITSRWYLVSEKCLLARTLLIISSFRKIEKISVYLLFLTSYLVYVVNSFWMFK